jgi:hypothetical protein
MRASSKQVTPLQSDRAIYGAAVPLDQRVGSLHWRGAKSTELVGQSILAFLVFPIPIISARIYPAPAFDELGKALSNGLKPLSELKCPRPFVSCPCVNRARIRCAKNDNGKWLLDSDRARVLGGSQRLK